MYEIKNRCTDEVLYRSDVANDVKAAVEEAVSAGANLSGANLSGANLVDANLGGATLAGANLSGANLVDANLGGANLTGANLSGATLAGAHLADATIRDGEKISLTPICISGLRWPVAIFDASMQIGCRWHTLIEWWKFSDDKIIKMDFAALDWWRKHKATLFALVEGNRPGWSEMLRAAGEVAQADDVAATATK